MIQSNELRIGNYVKDDIGRIGKVVSIGSNTIRLKMEFSTMKIDTNHDQYGLDVEPIPLTPEILENAGFVKNKYGNRFIKDELTNDIVKSNGFYMANVSQELKYLHQLQNLYFALTGEELIINL